MTIFPETLALLLLALAFDAAIGDPDSIWRRWPHPVVWIGWLISFCDRRFNRDNDAPEARRAAGVATLLSLLIVSFAAAALIEKLAQLAPAPIDSLLIALAASVFVAQKSLYQHIARVAAGFHRDGLVGARAAVSQIVGRDPERLDEAGVSRAAIESCAENFSDGVVAPAFWFALLGLPGLIAYKAVNTADSMIGHRNARYLHFGWAAARFDDLANLIPARFAGGLIAISGFVACAAPARAVRVMLRDAMKHRSPNAGWPESAMAASLGVALAGPRVYPGYRVDDPYLNAEGRVEASPHDIERALRVLLAACALNASIYALLLIALR